MIYYLVTATVKPGKTAEYLDIYSRELAPMLIKMVGAWHGYTGNMNQFYTLFVADDLADYQYIRTKMSQNKEYQRVAAKINALRESQTMTLLEPNAWSPMK
jgi:hypothetical protein